MRDLKLKLEPEMILFKSHLPGSLLTFFFIYIYIYGLLYSPGILRFCVQVDVTLGLLGALG